MRKLIALLSLRQTSEPSWSQDLEIKSAMVRQAHRERNKARLIAGLMTIFCCCTVWAIDDEPAFQDAALQARYETLTHELRCLVCQNETIADSGATLAADLRRELREQLAAGATDKQVLKFMTDRYGAFVLYKPPFEPRTWLLWLGPALLLLTGLIVVVRIILKRSKMNMNDDEMPVDTQ
jgi:cytochrome c-type biogenesis protein CcmH